MSESELTADERRRAELRGEGFTQLDVGALREIAEMVKVVGRPSIGYFLNRLADRIQAHLPPRTEITAFGDTERRFREADGSVTSEPFPQVDPYTGEFLPTEEKSR